MEKYYRMKIRKRLQNPYLIFVLGCLLGSLVFVCIYGLAVVNVTNVAWLTDSSQAEGLLDLEQSQPGPVPALSGLGLLPEKSMALSTGAGRGDLQPAGVYRLYRLHPSLCPTF